MRGIALQTKQPRAIADNLFRGDAMRAQRPHIQRALAFGEPAAGRVVDKRQMRIPWVFGVIWGVLRLWCVLRWCRSLRFRLAESRLDKRSANGDLQGVRPEQVAAAHDVVDAHVKIVHDHHQLVGEQAVGAAHDGVADVARQIEFLMAEHCIIELDGCARVCVGGHGDAQRMAVAVGQPPPDGIRIAGDKPAARAGIHHETVAFLRCGGCADVGARAEARVNQRGCASDCAIGCAADCGGVVVARVKRRIVCVVNRQVFQAMQRLTVQVVPGGLEHRIAVPIQSKPMQIVHHQFGCAGHHARFVDVFDAQQHAVAAAARGQPCSEHRIDVADVHAA